MSTPDEIPAAAAAAQTTPAASLVEVPLVDAGVVAANRLRRWRVDVVDFVSGDSCRFVLRWTDFHAAAAAWDWTGATVPAAQEWAAARGLPDPEQAMLDAVTDTQR